MESPVLAPLELSKSFQLFSNLAPELRIKIWSYACFARTLTLQYCPSRDKFTTSSPSPALLSVSREARTEALQAYRLCFSTSTHPARIYFNPIHDTLYLPRYREMGYDETLRDFRELIGAGERDIIEEVRKVAVDHVDIEIKRPWENYNKASFIRSFRKLQEVILVISSNNSRSSRGLPYKEGLLVEEVEFVPPKMNPEILLRHWASFRHGFVIEERLLENVCSSMKKDYRPFILPTVRTMSKMPRKEIR